MNVSMHYWRKGIIVIFTPLLVFLLVIGANAVYDLFAHEKVEIQACSFVVGIICSIISGIIVLNWMLRNVFEPILMLKKAIALIESGDLYTHIDYREDKEFAFIYRAYDDMREKLKDSAEENVSSELEMREIISNISHDLRTPITAVKGYVEGLLDGICDNDPVKRERYLRTVLNKSNDMSKLVDELSIYSKIGANSVKYNIAPVLVNYYFNKIALELGTELEAKNISFEYDNRVAASIKMKADQEYLKRTINNIVSNSVKNMPEKDGKISLEVSDEGEFIRVDLTDNGKGIPPEDIPHIFDRFFRGNAARTNPTGGSGIGLAIVKKIIDAHEGKIWVTSKVGEGTTMSFLLKKG